MVWSTTQSAEYSRDPNNNEDDLREERKPRRDKACLDEPPRGAPKCPPKPQARGLLDDSDTLIILALIMLLMREKADSKLIFALLLVIL